MKAKKKKLQASWVRMPARRNIPLLHTNAQTAASSSTTLTPLKNGVIKTINNLSAIMDFALLRKAQNIKTSGKYFQMNEIASNAKHSRKKGYLLRGTK